MTYDERTSAIGKLLREIILPRYSRPDHLDDATARDELRDMVADLNSAWPIMPAAQFASTGQALARALRMTYTGRNWPTIAHLAKALKAALAPPPSAVDGAAKSATKIDILDIRRGQLEGWCRGANSCPAHLITPENLALLAKDGVIRRDQIADMMAFAEGNHGVADDMPDRPARFDAAGVTIGFRRIGA